MTYDEYKLQTLDESYEHCKRIMLAIDMVRCGRSDNAACKTAGLLVNDFWKFVYSDHNYVSDTRKHKYETWQEEFIKELFDLDDDQKPSDFIDIDFIGQFNKAMETLRKDEESIIRQYYIGGRTVDAIAESLNMLSPKVEHILWGAMVELGRRKKEFFMKKDDRQSGIKFIDELGLSRRTYNILDRSGIETIDELTDYYNSYDTLNLIRNMTRECMEEIKDKMHELGYTDFIADNTAE